MKNKGEQGMDENKTNSEGSKLFFRDKNGTFSIDVEPIEINLSDLLNINPDEENPTVENNWEEEYKMLKDEIKDLKRRLVDTKHYAKLDEAYNRGIIDGLKFAIRCNGISGAEIKE